MAERYVRPPLIAREPASRRAADIRFWTIVAIVLAALVVVGWILISNALHNPSEQNPSVGGGALATISAGR